MTYIYIYHISQESMAINGYKLVAKKNGEPGERHHPASTELRMASEKGGELAVGLRACFVKAGAAVL